MQVQSRVSLNRLQKSCGNCGHVRICAVFRAVGPLLSQSWTDETRPFDPEDLADICREYVSAATIDYLKEAQ